MHLKEGTGEPCAGHPSPIGCLAARSILDPSFSSENFGIVPPTGSGGESLFQNYLNAGMGEPCTGQVKPKVVCSFSDL